MATEYFVKLWDNNIIQLGIWQTVYMTALTTIFAYLIGLPLGVILWATDKDGLHPNKGVNTVLGFIVNFFRSIPAVILMVAMIPAAKLLLGTSTGNGAVIVTLIIAAAPYVARMVESSLKEVPTGVIEAAQAMGCTNFQIICTCCCRRQSRRSSPDASFRLSPFSATRRWPRRWAARVLDRSPSSTATREARSSSSGSACC